MTTMFDFQVLNDQLLNMGAVNSVAEVHGLVTGKLCGGRALDADAWLDAALKFLDMEYLKPDETQSALFLALLEQSKASLNDDSFAFMPLLPDDEASLERRTQELGLWCEGFLHGIGSSGLSGDAVLKPEIADALRDLAKISQVELEKSSEVSEEEENDWMELVEYVKVAVLTIHGEILEAETKSEGDGPGPNENIH